MIKCPFCHFENEDGALFCEQCRSDLSDVPPTPVATPVKSAPPPPPVSSPPPLPAMPPLPPMPPPHLSIGSGGSFAPPPFPELAEVVATPIEPPPFGGSMVEPIPAVPVLEPYEAMPVEPFAMQAIPVVEAVEAVPAVEAVEAVEAIPAVPVVEAVTPFEPVEVAVMPTVRPVEPILPPPVIEPIAPPPPIVPVAVAAIVPPPPTPIAPITPPPPPPQPVAPVAATPVAATPVATGDGAFPPGSEPVLVVMRGLKRNAKYPVYEGPNYIGRSDDKPVDIDLEDQEPPDRVWCSRQHAVLHFENRTLAIEDLNSSNGTFVNRVKIYPGQMHQLKPDDVIQIGSVQMKVTI